jgi:hypothetical protein
VRGSVKLFFRLIRGIAGVNIEKIDQPVKEFL